MLAQLHPAALLAPLSTLLAARSREWASQRRSAPTVVDHQGHSHSHAGLCEPRRGVVDAAYLLTGHLPAVLARSREPSCLSLLPCDPGTGLRFSHVCRGAARGWVSMSAYLAGGAPFLHQPWSIRGARGGTNTKVATVVATRKTAVNKKVAICGKNV
jgi:hypothetical protein